ncbi:hypothetical protein C1H46_021191 [Malus baccata]|uniref:malate synthase n=1 Tax=Malus baccata TaxID=106549 RepID=A0A540M3B0_MALBA|nr:hypothetical protein C1H46_021191 [Malus baccata]
MMGVGTCGYTEQASMRSSRGGGGYDVSDRVKIWGRKFGRILTNDALQFVVELQRQSRNQIKYALKCRKEARRRYNEGRLCRALGDRKVEIMGPVERKMIINALNSGAKAFMVSIAHTFRQTQGAGFRLSSISLKWRIQGKLRYGTVFKRAEKMAGIERGSIRVTALIETFPAVFQMDEILYELSDHFVCLNRGRWDYIFSYVKSFQSIETLRPPLARPCSGWHDLTFHEELL